MAYAPSRVAPSNQFDSPSFEITTINNTAVTIEMSSGKVNTSGMAVGNMSEISISNGATNMATCKVEPMAISTATSILFLNAITMAEACSAAFPTIATIMTPINKSVHPNDSATTSNV